MTKRDYGDYVPFNYQNWHNSTKMTIQGDVRCGSDKALRERLQRRHESIVFDVPTVVHYDAIDEAESWLLGDKRHFEDHVINMVEREQRKEERARARIARKKAVLAFRAYKESLKPATKAKPVSKDIDMSNVLSLVSGWLGKF